MDVAACARAAGLHLKRTACCDAGQYNKSLRMLCPARHRRRANNDAEKSRL
jgi:hypothetical protein